MRGTWKKWTLSTVGIEPPRRYGLQVTRRPSLPLGQFSNVTNKNKHTVSIAEAIHVPYRPQQIPKRHNSRKNTWKDRKVKNFLYYVNTNSYPKFDVEILQDDREKYGELNLNKRKYLVCNTSNAIVVKLNLYYVKTNSYTKMSSQYYKTREESPEN